MSGKRSEVSVTWQEATAFKATDAQGGTAMLGVSASEAGIRPMDMVLAALAGCTGVDVVNILRKKKVDFSDLKIHVSGARADEHPRVYTDIQLTYYVWGNNIKEKDVAQAIQLSEEKYCSVSAMLKSTAAIHTDFRILAPEEQI